MKKKKTNEIQNLEKEDEQVLDLIGRQKFVDKIKKLVEISSPNKVGVLPLMVHGEVAKLLL